MAFGGAVRLWLQLIVMTWHLRFISLLALLVPVWPWSPTVWAQDAGPVLGVFDDGSQVSGDVVKDWHDRRKSPTLDGRKLFDAANPVRLMRYASRAPLPSGPFVEFANGDILPVRTIEYRDADPQIGMPPRLEVRLESPLTVFGKREYQTAVRADLVARIAWALQPMVELEPGLMVFANGRRVRASAVRLVEGGVHALTEAGALRVSFTELAELHMPDVDRRRAVMLDAQLPGPDEHGMVGRVRLSSGAAMTFRTDHLLLGSDKSSRRKHALHGVKPLWALEPIGVSERFVELRSFRRPHELPLSILEARTLRQHSYTGFKWDWQRHRSVQGKQLTIGDMAADLGIGMHASSQVAFKLPAGATTFTSWVGLDQTVGNGGCVHLRVYRDEPAGKPLWERKYVTGADEPIRVAPVDVSGAEHLVLEVDFAHDGRSKGADPLDIRDQVNWLHPLVSVDADALAPPSDVVRWFIPELHGWTIDERTRQNMRLVAMRTEDEGWATGIFIDRQGMTLSRQMTVDIGQGKVFGGVARENRAGGHSLRLAVDSTSMSQHTTNRFRHPGQWQRVDFSLAELMGRTVTLNVSVKPDAKAANGAPSAMAIRALGVVPLVRSLPTGRWPILPKVALTDVESVSLTRADGGKARPGAGRSFDGRPVIVLGSKISEGLALHAGDKLSVEVEPGFHRFVAVIALSGGKGDFEDAEIRIDGQSAWKSERFESETEPLFVSVDLPDDAETFTIDRGSKGNGVMAVLYAGFDPR